MENKKRKYEEPTIEVTEFEFEDSIATSGVGASLFEEVWPSWE